jgi:molybdopterin-guanine dinucleotide biosynthesis protein A
MIEVNEKPVLYYKNVTAIVLAGGKSSRMGTDKSRLPLGRESLITHILKQIEPLFSEILISANEPQRFASTGFKVIFDRDQGKGPLMGIISAMVESKNDLNFVQACDIPDTNVDLLAKMLSLADGFDAVVPQAGDGRYEPLFAVYRKSALKAMEHILENERGKVYRIPKHCRSRIVRLESSNDLINLNTIEDYKAFLQKH